ncbi:hypothetical protein P153DRAFT_371245 [Dothidotthia symphoricarpi CBS 119687]|uniref:DNA-binding protein RAP1 n=1 Tax=Dothidotthia symphoricarpi CBS 119687 TaxID=1392245 RepID=A0A6A5ZXC2_9PLEO|nr:uncharacterized protein P153DRAFT_371245 [Dothidotthia symphoricarpi CBS 119687]KAF2123926.1 hypothetical protein P153DRAFT_371245 [Dothidotthia symphoricarpi CBS 119687]
MAAPIVYDDVAEGTTLDGQLFAGKKFWVAQRVPSRTRLLDLITSNGGEVVMLEKKADYLIADHWRKDCPAGSISYTFVDKSIEKGELEDPEDHRAGPRLGEAREPGSISRPAKGGRAPYTPDEDRILYKWVRDAEAAGGQSSGNEIYKQLEAKYPRHPWQSWRDRYLKQLRTRPPSAFNIPDNAPPSPPSDQAVQTTPPVPSSSKQIKPSTSENPQSLGTKKVSGLGKSRMKEEYSTEQLSATFSSEDWEELYASVEVIDCHVGQDAYDDAWAKWAEAQDNQTAEQWRQYYEKVVRPQWLRDPVSKRDQINKKVGEKYNEKRASQSQQQDEDSQDDEAPEVSTPKPPKALNEKDTPASRGLSNSKALHDQPYVTQKEEIIPTKTRELTNSDDERFEQLLETHKVDSTTTAYTFFARENKWSTWNENLDLDHTELHELLLSQWGSLPEKDRAPYLAMGKAGGKRLAPETHAELMSSSTAHHESPKHLDELYKKTLKRIREEDADEPEDHDKESRPMKRLRNVRFSPASEGRTGHISSIGTQDQPLEISSEATSIASSEDEDTTLQPEEQTTEDIVQVKLEVEKVLEFDADQATDSIEVDEFKDIDDITPPPDEDDESDLPSNTPTPRATRRKAPAFDTQAILSSPSEGIPIAALPRPRYTRDLSSPSPEITISALPRLTNSTRDISSRAESEVSAHMDPPSSIHEPESEASTTQSLEEFRSFNSDDKPAYIAPLPRPRRASPSPTPSSASSTDSGQGDPDVPLAADEMNLFFDEMRTDVITDDFISKALMRTRCRPNLAMRVLDAWSKGRALPNQRGIWSREDDEAVESGDGRALMALERKHTLDGWGGITERLVFLEACRGR